MCEHRPLIHDERVTYYLTDCLQAYELRGAGAVMHSHSLNAVMATLLDTSASEFTVTNLEMIKASQRDLFLFSVYCHQVLHAVLCERLST